MQNDFNNLKLERKSSYAVVTLMRENKKNALSPELVNEITAAFKTLAEEEAVQVIILTGGASVFCAGADLGYLQSLLSANASSHLKDSSRLADMFLALYNSPKVTIAAVNGYALAGGCGLSACCDFIFANNESSKFGFTEVKIGFLAAIVGKFLINRVGLQKATSLLLTGKIISAEQALEIGFADEICADPIVFAEEFSQKLIRNSAESLLQTKQLLRDIASLSVNSATELALLRNVISRGTSDFRNGIESFLKK